VARARKGGGGIIIAVRPCRGGRGSTLVVDGGGRRGKIHLSFGWDGVDNWKLGFGEKMTRGWGRQTEQEGSEDEKFRTETFRE